MASTLYNFDALEALTEEDETFRQELVETYIESFAPFPALIAPYLHGHDLNGILFCIHKIKASVRMVQAEDFDRLLDQLYERAKSGKLTEEFIAKSLTSLEAHCQEIVRVMREHFRLSKAT